MAKPSLLNDILFHIVFGSKGSEKLTRHLLNALLGYTGLQKIQTLEIINPALDKAYVSDKGAVLDVKAQDGTGKLYNIEVQLRAGDAYVNRSIYYLARLYSDQLTSGSKYGSLAKSVGISLLDFVLFPEQKALHSQFVLHDPKLQLTLTDILELHMIELPKFSPTRPETLRTPFERWLYVLRFADLYEDLARLPENLQEEEGVVVAMETMRKAYARDEIRELMEAREKAERDRISDLVSAEDRGREEALLQVARKLQQMAYPPEEIARITGLPLNELP